MGLRDLIFEKKKNKKKPEKEKDSGVSFPVSNSPDLKPNVDVFSSPSDTVMPLHTPVDSNLSCEPHIDNVMSLYEKGFDGLNKDGYDFYEYFKAVLEAGADNPAMYKMALTMAKAMDPNVSKDSLLGQSDYYLSEINNVHDNYQKLGTKKKSELLILKENEEKSLKNDLLNVQGQILKLQEKERQLKTNAAAIDNKYAPQLHEIDCKLEANDTAKKEIFNSINKVKTGITNNL